MSAVLKLAEPDLGTKLLDLEKKCFFKLRQLRTRCTSTSKYRHTIYFIENRNNPNSSNASCPHVSTLMIVI